MLIGTQTWVFNSKPYILSSSAVGGPFESAGAIADHFDTLYTDIRMGESTFEKSEQKLLEEACNVALYKASLKKYDINVFLSGDLLNQIISSSFTARSLGVPFLGLFGACSTSMESLALGALLVESNFACNVLASTSSHNATAEKQFRYPTEYGAQKPPSSQWTVTGAGAAILSSNPPAAQKVPRVVSATIGKVIDLGITDPYNMGAAMAPAAVDTIESHLRDLNLDFSYYDLVVTGDLGRVGYSLAHEMLQSHGIKFSDARFSDCGMIIYKDSQPVFSGGSGCACTAVTTYGYLFNKMKRGEIKRLLVAATGALLSPLTYQQKESIPGISYAVSFEI